MAVPFVSLITAVNFYGWSRSRKAWSWSSSDGDGSSSSPSMFEGSAVVRRRGHGSWCSAALFPADLEACQESREGSDTSLQDGSSFEESGAERPLLTPTLLGYHILPERDKFTVYKMLVTGSEGDRWIIFRRYTDFCSLAGKIKASFPDFKVNLPPKRWIKNNYDEDFLLARQNGLQNFLREVTSHRDVSNSDAVRRFLCLSDPPSPFDSLEESRVFCETLEETNHLLQRELLEKQREVDMLKKSIEEKENSIGLLVQEVQSLRFPANNQWKSAANDVPDEGEWRKPQMGRPAVDNWRPAGHSWPAAINLWPNR